METTASPPLTPIRQYVTSPLDTSVNSSPTHSYRDQFRRRTSSFSSNHDRSPVTSKHRHRFSNASQLSIELSTPVDESGVGLGNLADELDQLDDDDEFDEGETEGLVPDKAEKDEASRDSGIDVSYRDGANRPQHNVQDSSGQEKRSLDEPHQEDDFSADLEELVTSVKRMASYTDATEDPLIPRTIGQLQDLGNQTSLEAAAQRLTTSTNSMTAHMTNQSRILQTVTQSLYPMFAFSAALDPAVMDETIPLVDALLQEIPQPDVVPVQKLQKLVRETADIVQALSQLTDTLQMGKQITTAAARHLRTTQTMVVELRRDRERAELARHVLERSGWEEKVKNRWCHGECRDIISGFEDQCNALRGSLEAAVNAAA